MGKDQDLTDIAHEVQDRYHDDCYYDEDEFSDYTSYKITHWISTC